jgi:(p)ppGpp synthase/HD superfamily hydrolase
MDKTSEIVEKYLWYIKNIYKNFEQDFDIIKKASDVAKSAHEWQFRKLTWTCFVAHPMRVAVMVAEKTDDLNLILAAILHDVVEDSSDKFSMEYIYKEFGDDIWFLVDSITSNILYFYKKPSFVFEDKSDKFLYWVMKDPRCAFLKLMDRDHNNKTLEWLKTDKQIRKSFETQALYNPLKKILRLDKKDFKFSDIKILFSKYIKENKIKNLEDFKLSLYQDTFEDIDSYNFELFYYNSNNIVWKIEDKKMFEKLIENNYFDNKTEIISLTQDEKWSFACLFKYRQWKVCDDEIKMSVSGFKY